MIDNGTLNYCWSQAMVAGFVAAGVTDAIISPGSRSTPLALAMLRQTRLRCHVVIDDRSAAFFAQGIAKASHRPTLLLATSGTAPANWLPAVIEASQSGIPLILLSADRPPELQDCGANQTIDQLNLFGVYVRASHALGTPEQGFDPDYLHRLAARACAKASWPHPGPVHINQPFREPLIPETTPPIPDIPEKIGVSPPEQLPAVEDIRDLSQRISGRPGIIVCGEMPTTDAERNAIAILADRLNCPILAEPLSGMRFGKHDRSHVFVRYNAWLATQGIADQPPEWILRFGAFPVTRHLQNFIAGISSTHALAEAWPRWTDPGHRITHLLRANLLELCAALLSENMTPAPNGWLHQFIQKEEIEAEKAESNHIGVLLDVLPDQTALFVGNSLAIRQLDNHSGHAGKVIHIYGNRGASGIDGNISTAMGIASVHGTAVALIGDLSCQHDLGGLALAQGRNVVIVVVNNAGGGIFDHLPQRNLPEFEQGWRTPQQISFEHAALTFYLGYCRAESHDEFRNKLTAAIQTGGPHLIELKLP